MLSLKVQRSDSAPEHIPCSFLFEPNVRHLEHVVLALFDNSAGVICQMKDDVTPQRKIRSAGACGAWIPHPHACL